ncbi:MAG: COQ9 family protein [Halocynthiibacter sp.]
MTRPDPIIEKLLNAALPHVTFDGWGEASFAAAATESGIGLAEARLICARGGLDLAVAFHRAGDAKMLAQLAAADLEQMRFRDRVATAIRFRLEAVSDKDLVRRAAALFALPQHAAEGAHLVWGTADAIWSALGDTSDDLNWYSKRASLSVVYGATVLYWLGDNSDSSQQTWEFLDRRIENIMQFEKLKSGMRKNPGLDRLYEATLGRVRAPRANPMQDMPGHEHNKRTNPE